MPGKTPKGVRYGGRSKGTPNKATDATRDLIEKALGANPVEKMANVARELLEGKRELYVAVYIEGSAVPIKNDAKSIELAVKLLGEVSQYHSPKRKALEVSGADGAPLAANVMVVLPDNRRAGV